LTLAKLWLVSDLPLQACHYMTDDRGYLRTALAMLEGSWLQSYDEFALIKGPFYPGFVAVVSWLGFPLLVAQQALYAVACGVFTFAVSRTVRSPRTLATLYAVIVLNPITFTDDLQRVVREGIYPAETLFVLAFFVGLLGAARSHLAAVYAWTIGASAALSAFWLTREEGIWILAPLSVLVAWPAFELAWRRPAGLLWRAMALALPFGVLLAALASVSAINGKAHGVYATVEFKARPFEAAVGALSRAASDSPDTRIPLPGAARQRIATVSPAFREIAAALDGPVKTFWRRSSILSHPELAESGEVTGGFWIFALRHAVARAGHHKSGHEAMRYYEILAWEVNEACDRGALPCGPPRRSLAPPLRAADLSRLVASAWQAFRVLVTLHGFSLVFPPSSAAPGDLAIFREVTHEKVSPKFVARGQEAGAGEPAQGGWRGSALRMLACVYRLALPLASALGVVAFGAAARRTRRALRDPVFVLAFALLVASLARVAVVAAVDALSFSAARPLYLAPAYPVWIAFSVVAVAAARPPAGPSRCPSGATAEGGPDSRSR
jgi:hypothetical protein